MQIAVTPPKVICAVTQLPHMPFTRLVFFLAKVQPAGTDHPVGICYAAHIGSIHGVHDGNVTANLTNIAVKNPRFFFIELGVEI